MRVSKETAARNREQIVAAAARLFREHGIAETGVDSITEAAGLTHGGLYSHFESKDSIAAEAIRFAFARSQRRWRRTVEGGRDAHVFEEIVTNYLSPAHRDSPGRGCVVAALAGDIARQSKPVRKAFTKELKSTIESIAHLMPQRDRSRRVNEAVAAFSCMVGALILARAVTDSTFSEQMLAAAANHVKSLATPPRRRLSGRDLGRNEPTEDRRWK
jgi:TetR/AcrR family transcriptional repressor of nem operon